MVPVLLLSAAALAWSGVSNLLLGDEGYLLRNLGLTVALLLGAHLAGWRAGELGLARAHLRRGAMVGVVAAGVVAAVVALGVVLADQVPLIGALLADERAAASSDRLLYEAVLRIPLGTALYEEVLFRGVLFAAWVRAVGRRGPGGYAAGRRAAVGYAARKRAAGRYAAGERAAMIGSSVVFGLWHVAPTAVALEVNGVAVGSPMGVLGIIGGVVVTTIAGLLFAWLRRVSGSLVAPILAHTATNVAGLLAAASVMSG